VKTKNAGRAAFFNLRALFASLLCLTAGVLTLFAFGVAQQPDDKRQTTSSSRWLTRLASTLGIQSPAERSASGGAIKLDKYPAERPANTPTTAPAVPYSCPPHDLGPVSAVRTGKLRDMRPIDPESVVKNYHPEPVPPKLPTKSGGLAAPIQAAAAQASAPLPTGVSFPGVGVGLAGFSPSSNPPDVNGRVGPTQFVQWNNTSFAVFNKTTGALEYGPAAGNTLFQSLGGVCASHNDGDPVVSYDILAGRWVISQFAVAGPAGSYSHQCIAVSTTEDATGEYYVYDFETDKTNFVDYPHTGVWPDGYYMSAHVFSAVPTDVVPPTPVAPPGAFIQGRIYVFERQKMIDGLPARMQSSNLGAEFGFLPADLDSLTPPPAGEAEFVLGPNFGLTNITDSFRVVVTWDPAPTIGTIPGSIQQGIGNPPCVSGVNSPARDCVPQPPPAVGTDYLDNLGGHYMYRLAYRNQGTQVVADESLVVSAPDAGSAADHGAVTWFEFRNNGSSTATPTLFQSGTYDPDSAYRWMPSIAMDRDRNMALGYSKSSTTIKPGIYVTGRLATDAINTMGAETEMQAGIGSQLGAGNRWGDYSAMTLDPIDQCTFYYTNEYLKTNGGFNWSTRIAAFKFPSCVSAANLYGTVTGTITSSETGAPIFGVRVALSNGYAGASDANGVYTILVPTGSYTATTADAARNCSAASPASASVAPPGGGTVTQNFIMTGTSKIEPNGFTIDDSLGTNNGIVNRAECVKLNLGVKNNGCAKATAISGKLTTTTPGVTVVDADSSYSDKAIDASGTNATPYKISVSNSFVCGTEIALSLNLTYAGGTKSISFTVPTCAGGPDQTIPTSQLMTSDATQTDRIGRDGRPSTCSGKASPGGGFTGTHYYKTYTFTNTAGAPRCYTVTINAGLNGPGDIESVAYDQTYDPTNIGTNYLGDSGISGLGTTIDKATYSFTVPAGHNFVVVVNTTGSATSGTIASSPFSGTVSGFVNNTAGPGDCSGSPTPSPTPTPTPTPTPSPSPGITPTPTPTPTPAPTPTPSPSPGITPTPTPTPTPSPTPTATPVPTPVNVQLLNISGRNFSQGGDKVGIGGFIISGSDKRVLARALGPSLKLNGTPIQGRMQDPILELHDNNGSPPLINNSWRSSQEAEISQTGLAPTDDREAAIVKTLPPGNYTVIVQSADGVPGIGVVEIYDLGSADPGELGNLSVRAQVETDDNVLFAGVILRGGTNKRVLFTARGPSLAVSGSLQNPILELHDGNGVLLDTNDDWKQATNMAEIQATGLAPPNDRESAILKTLGPGNYTSIVRGVSRGTGIGLAEVFKLDN